MPYELLATLIKYYINLLQERKYKFYNQKLEYFVEKYYEYRDMIPEDLFALVMPITECVLTTFQPGISVLTWDSVNVDGYLHQVSKL